MFYSVLFDNSAVIYLLLFVVPQGQAKRCTALVHNSIAIGLSLFRALPASWAGPGRSVAWRGGDDGGIEDGMVGRFGCC